MAFNDAQWIWTSDSFGENEYGEFIERFENSGSSASIRLSVCGDYTLSRKSLTYISSLEKKISPQFVYSFTYYATKEDDRDIGFTRSTIIAEKKEFFPRPTKKQVLPGKQLMAQAVFATAGVQSRFTTITNSGL